MNILEEIARGETYDLEFKLVPNEDRIKYQKTAVAFANGKGGRILFGVANDRTLTGIPNDKVYAEMDAIVNSISDACSPRIPVDAGIENIGGTSIRRRYAAFLYNSADSPASPAGICSLSIQQISFGALETDCAIVYIVKAGISV